MENNETKGKMPDYSGDGVAVWKNVDKNGKTYLSVKVLGHYVNCFKVEPKAPQQQKVESEAGYSNKEIQM